MEMETEVENDVLDINFDSSANVGKLTTSDDTKTAFVFVEIKNVSAKLPQGFSSVDKNTKARVIGVTVQHPDKAEGKTDLLLLDFHLGNDGKVLPEFMVEKSNGEKYTDEERARGISNHNSNIIKLFQAAGFPVVVKDGEVTLKSGKANFTELIGKSICVAWGAPLMGTVLAANAMPKGLDKDARNEFWKTIPGRGFGGPIVIGVPENTPSRSELQTRGSRGKEGWGFFLGIADSNVRNCVVADPEQARKWIAEGRIPFDGRWRPGFKSMEDYRRQLKLKAAGMRADAAGSGAGSEGSGSNSNGAGHGGNGGNGSDSGSSGGDEGEGNW